MKGSPKPGLPPEIWNMIKPEYVPGIDSTETQATTEPDTDNGNKDTGDVSDNLTGSIIEEIIYDAVSANKEEIRTGDQIVVIDITGGNILVVEQAETS